MEIKYLRLVKSIVEMGSMAKAKNKLCLTQSALSHQLKEAESMAGTALFIRANKKLILTAAGELVYKTAVEVLDRMRELDDDLRAVSKEERGIIRLCTACFTNYRWLPELTRVFEQVYPQVEIKIYPEYINECMERLQNHDLDAVIINKPNNGVNIRYEEIMTDEMVAIVPPGHEWADRDYVGAADFKGRNLIVFSKPMESVVVYNRVLRPNGVEPERVYEVPMTESMIQMVVAGMGVAVIPYWIAKPYIDRQEIVSVRVTRKGLFRSLGIGFLRKVNYPAYYEVLVDFLKENLTKTV